MRILNITLSILFYLNTTAQIKKADLIGTWTKVNTEMKDGSDLIPVYPDYVNYFEMTFLNKEYYINYYPAQENKYTSHTYILQDNLIYSSINLSYEIEKLTKDSLIVVEKIKWLEDDQRKRFYFVNKEKIIATEALINLDNKHLIASTYYTPLFKENIEFYLNKGIKKKQTNLKLKGSLILDLNNKKVEVTLIERDNEGLFQEQVLIKLLEDSFKKWELKGFKKYQTISIDFVLNMEKTKTYRGIKIALNTKSFTQLKGRYGLSYNQLFDGNKYFNLGINSYQSKDYEKAITFFTKSFDLNHTKAEALYNRAATYTILNRHDLACSDWEKLMILGQKQGEKLFVEKCNNSKN